MGIVIIFLYWFSQLWAVVTNRPDCIGNDWYHYVSLQYVVVLVYLVQIKWPKCLCQGLLPYGWRGTDDTLTVSQAITIHSSNGRNVLFPQVIYFKWTADTLPVCFLSSFIPLAFFWEHVMSLSDCRWELSSWYCFPAAAWLCSHCTAFSGTFWFFFL